MLFDADMASLDRSQAVRSPLASEHHHLVIPRSEIVGTLEQHTFDATLPMATRKRKRDPHRSPHGVSGLLKGCLTLPFPRCYT